MPLGPPPPAAPIAPLVFGVDLSAVFARLDELEFNIMTTQAEAFEAVAAKIDDIKADFTALLEQLAAERENLTEAGQAALDTLTAKVDALDLAVGDGDGSDTPDEPVDEPADPDAPAED